MDLPERFSNLPAYAFPRLRALLDSHPAGGEVLHMSIGEPKHEFPSFIKEILLKNIRDFNRYPSNDGSPELLNAISDWVNKRYGVVIKSESEILSLNGTREGLFNAQIALSPETKNGKPTKVLIPNPFIKFMQLALLQYLLNLFLYQPMLKTTLCLIMLSFQKKF